MKCCDLRLSYFRNLINTLGNEILSSTRNFYNLGKIDITNSRVQLYFQIILNFFKISRFIISDRFVWLNCYNTLIQKKQETKIPNHKKSFQLDIHTYIQLDNLYYKHIILVIKMMKQYSMVYHKYTEKPIIIFIDENRRIVKQSQIVWEIDSRQFCGMPKTVHKRSIRFYHCLVTSLEQLTTGARSLTGLINNLCNMHLLTMN